MTITQVCARKLKALREINNYTQEYVASALSISQNAYSLLEKGVTKITLDRLEALADFYRIPPAELLNESFNLTSLNNNAGPISTHSNLPPALSQLEKKMYEQTISRLEADIEKLYGLIHQLTSKITSAPVIDGTVSK